MKRLFAIPVVMLLSTAMFFTVAYAVDLEGTIPVNGKWSGVTSFVPGNCPAGSQMIQSLGKGVMTLTAASEWVSAPACLDLSTGIANGTAVIIAANGDAIFLTAGIRFTFDSSGSAGTWEQDTIGYGGTGKFAGTGGTSFSSGEFHFISSTEALWSGTNVGDVIFP